MTARDVILNFKVIPVSRVGCFNHKSYEYMNTAYGIRFAAHNMRNKSHAWEMQHCGCHQLHRYNNTSFRISHYRPNVKNYNELYLDHYIPYSFRSWKDNSSGFVGFKISSFDFADSKYHADVIQTVNRSSDWYTAYPEMFSYDERFNTFSTNSFRISKNYNEYKYHGDKAKTRHRNRYYRDGALLRDQSIYVIFKQVISSNQFRITKEMNRAIAENSLFTYTIDVQKQSDYVNVGLRTIKQQHHG